MKRSLKKIAGFEGGYRRTSQDIYIGKTHSCSILQVPKTQLAKMSIDPKSVELTADVLEIFFIEMVFS